MLKKLLASTVYARIYANRLRLRHIESAKEIDVNAAEPYTSQRLLVGNFAVAETLLRKALKEFIGGKLFALSPTMLIHPMEKIDGGLSQIEERALLELGLGAGARKTKVYLGEELSDAEVMNRLSEK